jgi:competence protein ComGC
VALAGYCASCGENVWLTPSGTCPRGHGAQDVSSVYEAAGPAAPAPVQTAQDPTSGGLPPVPQPIPGQTPERGKNKALVWVIVALVLAALLGCCLVGSILAAIAIPAFTTRQAGAQEKVCYSNERNVEAAAQVYGAENNGEMPESIDTLVPDYLKTVPACPSGGTYTWDPADGTDICSVHGHYK